MRKRSSSDKNAKKTIFAVVIGINKYGSSSYTNLCGAAEDADKFNNYLSHNLGVPSDNIYNLRDENASRDEIIRSIFWLKSHPKIKKHKAVIIIYFAGHGDWTSKGTQMICPSDIDVKMPSRNGRRARKGRTNLAVEGIYGHFLAELLMELSRDKGGNITIFLDCCHSTGMLQPRATIKRRKSTTQKEPSCRTSSAIFSEDRELYTVITACGSRKQALEDGSMKAGLFTSRLLEVLNSPDAEYLTYMSLMHQLKGLPNMQIAHCEGARLQRPLFNCDPALAGDPSLVLTRSLPDGSIILYAGSAQGIVEGDKLSMHATNLSNRRINPPSGNLEVASVEKFFSILLCDPILDSPHFPPSLFYCKLVDSSTRKNTVLFSPDKDWLMSMFPSDINSLLPLSIGDDNENYDLRLDISDDQVQFRQSAKLVTTYIDPCMVETIDMDDKYKIRKVVERFIHFRSNLARNPAHNLKEIEIELNELIQQSNNGKDRILIPSDTITLADDQIQIQITSNDTKMYGLTVRNRSKVKLYPYLFYFDPMDLTIKELYQPPAAAGEYWSTVKTDSLLLPSSEVTIIGYGSSARLHFCLPSGQRVPKVVHLRLYLSSCPTSFESMVRETSPFDDVRLRSKSPVVDSEDDSPQDWWMAKTITFIANSST